MAANKITNTLILNITATEDSSQNVIVNRSQQLQFDSVVTEGMLYKVLANGDNAITLPSAQCFQLYVKNNDAALIITPKITAFGGAQTTREQLYPGDVLVLWQVNTGVNGGFSALTLNASGAGALVEFFIGA